MKYAKYLMQELKKYNSKIQKHCFQYKKWKKYIKYKKEYISKKWKSKLIKECKYIDELFYTSCFNNISQSILNQIAFINTNTLYKICKKLDKNLKLGAMEFLNEVIKSRKYKFTDIAFDTLI